MTSGLSVRGLYKSYGANQVLRGLDLEVPRGARVAVLGPSGGGKTTLLRVVAGFERCDGGAVQLGGRMVDGDGRFVPPEHRMVGYVAQEGALFPHVSVAGNVGFGLRRARRQGARVAQLLEMVGLAGFGSRRPHELSGGEQQRVALARALAPEPEVVLLDEPFAALDAGLRASVRADVGDVLRSAGTTSVLVTHDQDEALSFADVVAVLRDGCIVQAAPPAVVYARPVDADVARFVGHANVISGSLDGRGFAVTALGRSPLVADGPPVGSGPASVMVRPEQIEVGVATAAATATGRHRGAATGGHLGRVTAAEYLGHASTLRVQMASPGETEVVVRTTGDGVPAPGDAVVVRVRGRVVAWPEHSG